MFYARLALFWSKILAICTPVLSSIKSQIDKTFQVVAHPLLVVLGLRLPKIFHSAPICWTPQTLTLLSLTQKKLTRKARILTLLFYPACLFSACISFILVLSLFVVLSAPSAHMYDSFDFSSSQSDVFVILPEEANTIQPFVYVCLFEECPQTYIERLAATPKGHSIDTRIKEATSALLPLCSRSPASGAPVCYKWFFTVLGTSIDYGARIQLYIGNALKTVFSSITLNGPYFLFPAYFYLAIAIFKLLGMLTVQFFTLAFLLSFVSLPSMAVRFWPSSIGITLKELQKLLPQATDAQQAFDSYEELYQTTHSNCSETDKKKNTLRL